SSRGRPPRVAPPPATAGAAASAARAARRGSDSQPVDGLLGLAQAHARVLAHELDRGDGRAGPPQLAGLLPERLLLRTEALENRLGDALLPGELLHQAGQVGHLPREGVDLPGEPGDLFVAGEETHGPTLRTAAGSVLGGLVAAGVLLARPAPVPDH